MDDLFFFHSEQINEISKALLGFQGRVEKVKKVSKNPFFNSSYAPLSEILDKVSAPLQELGLLITQHPTGTSCLTTMLIHGESGQFFKSVFQLSPVKADPQSLGSAITYARRYSIGAILCLNIDEDDDGNAANARSFQSDKPRQAYSNNPKKDWLNPDTPEWDNVASKIITGNRTLKDAMDKYSISKENQTTLAALEGV